MSAPSTSGLSVIKSYCYELSTLNKVYFTLLYFILIITSNLNGDTHMGCQSKSLVKYHVTHIGAVLLTSYIVRVQGRSDLLDE